MDENNTYFTFCRNCIDKRENEYRIFEAGEFLVNDKWIGSSRFYCTKCKKEFIIREKMFILKHESD